MATIRFTCPKCTQEFEAPDDMAGEMADCPGCGTRLSIPATVPETKVIRQLKISKVTPPAPVSLSQVEPGKVIITDIKIPLNSLCALSLKMFFVMVLISFFFAGIWWMIVFALGTATGIALW